MCLLGCSAVRSPLSAIAVLSPTCLPSRPPHHARSRTSTPSGPQRRRRMQGAPRVWRRNAQGESREGQPASERARSGDEAGGGPCGVRLDGEGGGRLHGAPGCIGRQPAWLGKLCIAARGCQLAGYTCTCVAHAQYRLLRSPLVRPRCATWWLPSCGAAWTSDWSCCASPTSHARRRACARPSPASPRPHRTSRRHVPRRQQGGPSQHGASGAKQQRGENSIRLWAAADANNASAAAAAVAAATVTAAAAAVASAVATAAAAVAAAVAAAAAATAGRCTGTRRRCRGDI